MKYLLKTQLGYFLFFFIRLNADKGYPFLSFHRKKWQLFFSSFILMILILEVLIIKNIKYLILLINFLLNFYQPGVRVIKTK